MSLVTEQNPLGLDGFEFVEFTSPDPAAMKALIEQMGFVAASRHPTKPATRYKQGRINLIVNEDTSGQVADFRAAHGPSANGMAFRVENAETAFAEALKRGAKAADASGSLLGPDAKVLEGEGSVDPTAFCIHARLHQLLGARAGCVMHTHQAHAAALCCV